MPPLNLVNPTFDNDIKRLFKQNAIDCMQYPDPLNPPFIAFDLTNINDIKAPHPSNTLLTRADLILREVAMGSPQGMPKGGPEWDRDMIRMFAIWIDNGMPQ